MTKKEKIDLIVDIYEILKEILIRENQIGPAEFLWIVSLSKTNKILSIEGDEVSTEASQETRILPKDVFRIAILKEADRIIIVHSHATGKVEPSQKELDITNQMIQVGKIVNIELLDHLIINEKEFYSFESHGLMEKLKKSKKWVPPSLDGIED
jgi:DNA repair protein RadC